MEPDIRDRDHVVVDATTQKLLSGRTYARMRADALSVNRLERILRGPIVLRYENQVYQSAEQGKDHAETARMLRSIIWHERFLE